MTVRPTWDQTWMTVADVMALRSKCVRAQVGVVIVSSDQKIVATGYNGAPSGYPTFGTCDNFCPRSQKQDKDVEPGYSDCIAAHAEMNAIAWADRGRMMNSTLYVTGTMCFGCAKVVANSGVSRIVMREVTGKDFRNPDKVNEFLIRCGLDVKMMNEL